MATRQLPDAETLRKLLRYEPETGNLYWRPREPGMMRANQVFDDEVATATWNKRFAGKLALHSVASTGYRRGTLFSVSATAHRVIWKMVTGEEPQFIDHINGARTDNRFCNLRSVSKWQNNVNCRLDRRNRSGCPGVKFIAKSKRWEARITKAGVVRVLGSFKDREQAILARKKAEREMGFHPNHGRAT